MKHAEGRVGRTSKRGFLAIGPDQGAPMGRRISGRVFPVVVVLAVSACGESGTQSPAAPEPPRPTNVAVRPAEARLIALDATVQLTSEVRDQNGRLMSGADVSWTSSDAVVAHVNASGLVTAVANGSATITADAGGATGTATVTVEQEATALTLGPEALTFRALGDTVRLVAEATDANGHPIAVTWTSSEAAVAHVDAAGLVTAVGNGSARITATAGAAIRSAVVVVEQVAVVLELAPEAVQFRALGDTLRLVAEATDANGHAIESVTWISSNAAVASVDASGVVTARGNGSARITATASGAISSATVTVEQEAVALGGLPTADTLLWYGEPGDTLRLVVTAAVDANGHPVERVPVESIPIKWSTSLSGVATVDDGGLVKGAGEGFATITATAANLGEASTELTVINRDRATLAAFYHATGGPGWRCNENWITHVPMDTWCGVGTSVRADGVVMVTGLWLGYNNLTGPIPPELTSLASLEELLLYNNQLTGPIPPELGNLAGLGSLALYGNQLTGPIPPELGNLASLGWLAVHGNQLTGPIPPELGNLARISGLYLGRNALTGPIPPELGNLARLRGLDLRQNALTGPIPPELGNLASLEELLLNNNQLAGPIPELGNLTTLRELDLGHNALTGPIPPELGNFANLESLSFNNNQLAGPIPELGNLARLRELDLGGNALTGPIPPELGNLARLGRLNLGGNQLTGPIPPELGDLANLNSLSLSSNQLTGPIPSELGNLVNLEALSLSNNQLTGSIPRELGGLVNLQSWLVLHGNQLTGPIPPELGNLTWLVQLNLGSNQLTGPIPAELGNLTRLFSLRLHGNAALSGRLPETLTGLQLWVFYWHDTQLCHPPTPSFQRWLQSIREHRGGPPCGS